MSPRRRWEWKARSAAWAAVMCERVVVRERGTLDGMGHQYHIALAVVQAVVVEPHERPHRPPQQLPVHSRQVQPRDGHADEAVQGALEGKAVQEEERAALPSSLPFLRRRGDEEGGHLPFLSLFLLALCAAFGRSRSRKPLELARQQPRVPCVPHVVRHGDGPGGLPDEVVIGHDGVPVHVI